jgi:hypothetical protein
MFESPSSHSGLLRFAGQPFVTFRGGPSRPASPARCSRASDFASHALDVHAADVASGFERVSVGLPRHPHSRHRV